MTRKYRNTPVTIDGIRFDSKAEAKRWAELRLLERAGVILDLQRQVSFPITFGGVKITTYRADFVYREAETGETAIEDVKGVRTPEYRIKAKLMAAQGMPIREVAA
jgi:hypothetical protein